MMIAKTLLDWYNKNYRDLPWRAAPGSPPPDPYRIWLSEIMLQQTTVATVIPYFEKFVAKWPSVPALAAADLDQVLTAWSGLGYYARARNLYLCAQIVARDYGGRFPETESTLIDLPGVGPYTAAAIAAIAFDEAAVVVDGNVERVVSRLFAVETPLPASKPILKQRAAELTPTDRPGDYAQAMMDLGATVCRPRDPDCGLCPIASACKTLALDIAQDLPRRAPKERKPVRRGTAYWVQSPEGQVMLRRRPPKGLLGGMLEVPSTPWTETPGPEDLGRDAPAACEWQPIKGQVRHTFTHFHLELNVVAGKADKLDLDPEIMWADPRNLDDLALPTVMKKVVELALATEE